MSEKTNKTTPVETTDEAAAKPRFARIRQFTKDHPKFAKGAAIAATIIGAIGVGAAMNEVADRRKNDNALADLDDVAMLDSGTDSPQENVA